MQERREMGTYCICITDSLCYKAEANTPKGKKKKKKKEIIDFTLLMFYLENLSFI